MRWTLTSAYEIAKTRADALVEKAIARGLPAIFMHPSAVYGPMSGTKVPPVMPLWVAKLVAQSGVALSRLTHRPPLLTQAELNVLCRTGKPDTARIMRELGWCPTPFAQGLARTLTSFQRVVA